MTFKPTEKNQKAWIRKHLNNGDLTEDYARIDTADDNAACLESMEWLESNDIATLEEAWDKCPDPTWLAWMHARMSPTRKDALLWVQVARKAIDVLPKSVKDKEKELEEWTEFSISSINRTTRLGKVQLTFAIDECGDWMDPYVGIEYRIKDYSVCDFIRKHIPNPWKQK